MSLHEGIGAKSSDHCSAALSMACDRCGMDSALPQPSRACTASGHYLQSDKSLLDLLGARGAASCWAQKFYGSGPVGCCDVADRSSFLYLAISFGFTLIVVVG